MGISGHTSAGQAEGQRPRRADAVRNEAAVIDAAMQLSAELGIAINHTQVAERAGLGRATVYRAFPTHEDLITAVVERRISWMRERQQLALEAEDAWEGFVKLIRDQFEAMRCDAALMYAVTPGTGLEQRVEAALGAEFEQLLARVKAAGRIRPDVVAGDFGILTSGAADSLIRAGDHAPESWRRAADLVLAAAGTHPDS